MAFNEYVQTISFHKQYQRNTRLDGTPLPVRQMFFFLYKLLNEHSPHTVECNRLICRKIKYIEKTEFIQNSLL